MVPITFGSEPRGVSSDVRFGIADARVLTSVIRRFSKDSISEILSFKLRASAIISCLESARMLCTSSELSSRSDLGFAN